jgi:Integrator complex subunit 7, C-terminal domain
MDLFEMLNDDDVGSLCNALRARRSEMYPALVDKLLVLLAERFRATEDNFSRYYLLRAFDTCAELKLLASATSSCIDDIVRRVTLVLNSNDPHARALALHVLCSLADIVADRAHLHHHVFDAFQSYEIEQRNDVIDDANCEKTRYVDSFDVYVCAALAASRALCARSPSFAANLLPILSAWLGSISVSLDVKLKLIDCLQYASHNVSLRDDDDDGDDDDVELVVDAARSLCLAQLDVFPSRAFVVAVLDATTTLAIDSSMHVDAQFDLLARWLADDARSPIKMAALRNVRRLCAAAAGRSTARAARTVAVVASVHRDWPDARVRCRAADVLARVARHEPSAVLANRASLVEALGTGELEPSHAALCVRALATATALSLSPLLLSTSSRAGNNNTLAIARQLCDGAARHWHASTGADLARSLAHLASIDAEHCAVIVDALLALVAADRRQEAAHALSMLVGESDCAARVARSRAQRIEALLGADAEPLRLRLALLIAWLRCSAPSDATEAHVARFADAAIDERAPLVLTLAEEALCCALPAAAAALFERLAARVRSDQCAFWLGALALLGRAEHALVSSHSSDDVLGLMHRALVSLRAAVSPGRAPFVFARRMLRLRIEFLQCVDTLRATLRLASRDGRNAELARQLGELADSFGLLRRSFADMEGPSTRALLDHQLACATLAHAVSLFAVRRRRDAAVHACIVSFAVTGGTPAEATTTTATSAMRRVCVEALRRLAQLSDAQRASAQVASRVLEQLTDSVRRVPASYGRYLFRARPRASAQLTVRPCAPPNNEPLMLAQSTHLPLHIEGVVAVDGRHAALRRRFERLETIDVDIAQTRVDLAHSSASVRRTHLSIAPHGGGASFVASCTVDFDAPGLYELSISAAVVESNDTRWSLTHAPTLLCVQVY